MKIYQISYRASKVGSNTKKLFRVFIKTDKQLEEIKKQVIAILIEDAASKLNIEDYEVEISRGIESAVFKDSVVHETHGMPSIVLRVDTELARLNGNKYGSETTFIFPFNIKKSEIIKHATKLAYEYASDVIADSIKITKTKLISHIILEV